MSRSSHVVEGATAAVRDLASTLVEQTPQIADRAITVLGDASHTARVQLDRQLDSLASGARSFADEHADDVPNLIERAQRAAERLDDVAPGLRENLAPVIGASVVTTARRKPPIIAMVVVGSVVLIGATALIRRRRRAGLVAQVGDVPEVPPIPAPVEAPIDPVDPAVAHLRHGAA